MRRKPMLLDRAHPLVEQAIEAIKQLMQASAQHLPSEALQHAEHQEHMAFAALMAAATAFEHAPCIIVPFVQHMHELAVAEQDTNPNDVN